MSKHFDSHQKRGLIGRIFAWVVIILLLTGLLGVIVKCSLNTPDDPPINDPPVEEVPPEDAGLEFDNYEFIF